MHNRPRFIVLLLALAVLVWLNLQAVDEPALVKAVERDASVAALRPHRSGDAPLPLALSDRPLLEPAERDPFELTPPPVAPTTAQAPPLCL